MNHPNEAAGSQPGSLPVIDRSVRADQRHFTPGRVDDEILHAVLHNTEGKDSLHWLADNPNSAVSVHTLISRDGVRHDLVDFADTAWHVGRAKPPITNANSAGIEFENLSNGKGVTEPYTPAQLNSGAHWVAAVMFSFGIPWERVVRHGDVALPAGRRHDPSNFDMAAFKLHVDAWRTFFSTLPESEHAHYIQGAAPDFTFTGPPTISEAVARRVLMDLHSPILTEYPLSLYFAVCAEHGINFAVALAFTVHENRAGTAGVTAPLKNWGAVRNAERPALASQDSPVQTPLGPFAKYETFLDSLRDWCLRILGSRYLQNEPNLTIREALKRYAPASDHNDPSAYADEVQRLLHLWAEQSGL